MPQKNRILITGSSGMLGTDLWQKLEKDYEVYGTDIVQRTAYSLSRAKSRDVQRFVKSDITRRKNITAVVDRIKPDIVIHAAAWTDVDGCERDSKRAYKINSEGTENIALACKRAGAALIYISTDFVFDGKKKRPYTESDKPHPVSVYGDSKYKGEIYIKRILKKYYILRTSWLYGKNGRNFVDIIVDKAKTEKELKVVNDQIGCPTYTKDLAKAIHILLDKIFMQYAIRNTQYATYHISNSGSVSWYGYAKEILKLSDLKTKVIPISSEELRRPAKRPAMSILDNAKFAKFTGHEMRPWSDALKEYLS